MNRTTALLGALAVLAAPLAVAAPAQAADAPTASVTKPYCASATTTAARQVLNNKPSASASTFELVKSYPDGSWTSKYVTVPAGTVQKPVVKTARKVTVTVNLFDAPIATRTISPLYCQHEATIGTPQYDSAQMRVTNRTATVTRYRIETDNEVTGPQIHWLKVPAKDSRPFPLGVNPGYGTRVKVTKVTGADRLLKKATVWGNPDC